MASSSQHSPAANVSKQVHSSTCRGWAKHVVSRPWFDSAVVSLILVNCVFLALDDPTVEVRLLPQRFYAFSSYDDITAVDLD